jgi:16S rRNA (guanine966-N2)-methyltransferase
LHFADDTTARPTGDRVRETVFNWLQPYVAGAEVLDLFAGSGALSLEALSRGASKAVCVEKDRRLTQSLQQNVSLLKAEAQLVTAEVMAWLKSTRLRADIVFMDPPYPANLWAALLQQLPESGLKAGALIYTEQPVKDALLDLPDHFELLKQRTAGQVRFMLLRYQPSE